MLMPEPARQALASHIPFPPRLGKPPEYAALALHMLENTMLNGETVRLDGADAAAFAVIPPRSLTRAANRRGAPDLGAVLGHAGSDGHLSFELPVALWGARYLSFERTQPVEATTGVVELGVGGDRKRRVRIQVHYHGLFPLKEPCVLLPTPRGVQIHAIGAELTSKTPYAQDNPVLTMLGSWEPKASNLGTQLMGRLMLIPYKAWAERQRQAYLIGYTNDPSPVRAQPNVRDRAFATLRVIRLPIRYVDGVPFGVARATREASTVAEVNTTTVARRVETRFKLPGSGHHERAGRVSLMLRAPRGELLATENLRLEGLSYATQPPAWKPLPVTPGRVQRAGSGLSMTLDLPAPRSWISPGDVVRIRQTFDRPRRERDGTFSARIDVAIEWGDPAQMAPKRPQRKGSPAHRPGG